LANKPEHPVELLAPARDAQIGRRAIDCGADAVYIAADRFGAREQAGNSIDEIASLVQYAHGYWARVYVTVNTILFDHEIPLADRLIRQLYDIKADGVIIQDLGLLELDLPPIPLIASTQMNNRALEHIRFLEQIGFRRVILARETSLEDIKRICQNTSLEIEFFLHGALCVGFSGQCYLSYALGGRSGNRGQCAQPCRKSYTLLDAKKNILAQNIHALSLKDLNLDQQLEALLEAGVTSFKIEGRLKDSAYVMNLVSYYRRRLDQLLPLFKSVRASSGSSLPDFNADPAKTFNRGYISYFISSRKRQMAALYSPKSTGEKLGAVSFVSGNAFQLDTEVELHAGDGLCWYDEHKQLVGTSVQRIEQRRIIPNKLPGLKPGTIVYRNHDHQFLHRLEKSKTRRTIGVHMHLLEANYGFVLQATDEDHIQVAVPLFIPKRHAKSEQALQTIRQQLAKSGDTIFHIAEIDIQMDPICFFSVSVLNQWRRDVLQALLQERLRQYPQQFYSIARNDVPYPHRHLSFRANVLNSWARSFYQRHGVEHIDDAAEAGPFPAGEEVMTTKYCLRHELGWCKHKSSDDQDQDPLILVDELNQKLFIRFDCTQCEMKVFLGTIK
jgi:23S rRNA 5-hydroxycytidine C2501 synthase